MVKISNIIFSPNALLDYEVWQTNDKKIFKRINELIDNILITPFSGLGKPEPLKHDYAGKWSRRINREHRLVYEIKGTTLKVIQCRYHYDG